MCLQDLWIGRHTTAKLLAASGNVSWGKNPQRIAILTRGSSGFTVLNESNNIWYSTVETYTATAFTTTDTNEVPPTDNTGVITPTAAGYAVHTHILPVSLYGQLITGAGSISYAIVDGSTWELVADPVLDKLLSQLESKEGWPLYGLKGLG